MPNRESQQDTDVLTERKQKLQKPPLYKVLLHNDNYTTMEFVVYVLMSTFHHSESDAIRIMLQVHHQEVGVAGVYTFEVAETKVAKVAELAREYDYPLLCTLEEE
ncbi:MAG: ATP-dependent Clp protease adapter ClpS [Acidobacteriota bacterium]|nr:ATP-dependent Clp protease adapter ClpS [Acidobacteriota bacterium]